ncbi:MAG: hypothetical protein OXG10_07845 [Candidatus Dadabacteria bacterium]|nr:hypothetical protein [Candidatus Dadabacteria bacterium]
MSRWNILFYIIQAIFPTSSLSGWIYTWLSGTHKFLGVTEIGPFEWYLIFQASVVAIIIINWPRVVRLWKYYTKRDQHEELEIIAGKFLVAERFIEVTGGSNPALVYEYEKAKDNLMAKLMELDFVILNDANHSKFMEKFKWFAFRLSVELRKTKYNKLQNLWEKTCKEIEPENS